MATYSTSFVVNAADLAKILEQIKIAERNAAGEALIDIIGKDSALLPMGLRTVDGSYNHLLPGQEQTGAADEIFPRLLPPEYINEADLDKMPLGPGAPTIINHNYNPTIAGTHSVADADPRIISNLIVDQTAGNPSAIFAALQLLGIEGLEAETAAAAITASYAASIDPVLAKEQAQAAETASAAVLQAAKAAKASAQTLDPLFDLTAAAYATAATESEQAKTKAASAKVLVDSLSNLLVQGETVVPGVDGAAGTAAFNAVMAARNEAIQLTQALSPVGFDLVAAADVSAAVALRVKAAALGNALTSLFLDLPNGSPIDVEDIARLNTAKTLAADLTKLAVAVDLQIDASRALADENAVKLNAAQAALNEAQSAFDAAHAANLTINSALTAAKAGFQNLVGEYGLSVSDDGSIAIEHRSADIGLSPANSGWMTLFGQFFDHGLDLVTKGGNGTVYIPLQADDPLIAGADHIMGTPDDLPEHLRFMTLTRATPFIDPVTGKPTESQNTTTPFVDQNQTYTSSASHQVFLREYKFSVDSATDNDNIADSHAVNTGRLLNGVNGGIANWAEVKAQAAEKLGIKLSDNDVNDVVRLAVDPYGKFEAGANGYAQIIVKVTQTTAGSPPVTTVSEIKVEGHGNGGLDINNLTLADVTLAPGYDPALGTLGAFSVQYTGHAFLNDIAHTAAPVMIGGQLKPDDGDVIGNAVPNDGQGHNLKYDNELLDAHFVTGDGRGNENIGLTAVHTIFHSEHNRLVEVNKDTLIATGDANVVNEWLAAGPGGVRTGITQAQLDLINNAPTSTPAEIDAKADAIDALNWDGERLFQAARFVTEMQYQHLVFEEFARRVQPNVDPFVFTNSADLDPAIVAEFAHAVYRFGHSQLTDTVDRLNNNLDLVEGTAEQKGLIESFLNPQLFTASAGGIGDDEAAAGAIIRGMSRQVGNEIDEFVVEALRDNLLGLPLDLAALNLARGREQGIATLNHAREQIYAMTGAADIKPYTSWLDFAQHLKHPLSVVNFIAAYGTHAAIATATTMEEKRDAALLLVMGDGNNSDGVKIRGVTYSNADRLDFLNATGIYAPDGPTVVNANGTSSNTRDDSRGGLNAIDLWIGGLAEEHNEFGGQLGTTFNYIFEYQMEHLQNGDRMYYLSRTQGMNLLNLLEPNNFTDIIMRNTDLGDLHATHLPALIMSVPDMILELDTLVKQEIYGTANGGLDPTHDDTFLQLVDPKVVRINGTDDIDGNGFADGNVLKFSGGEHVVLGGTEGNDTLIGDKGIDTLWGDGGDDYLNAGMESDQVYGGTGDDIIEDPFGDDFLRGEAGDDVIIADQGIDLLFGGEGNDFIMGVTDTKEVFAGPGDDFVLGGTAPDVLMGNEGDDWIEGGEGFDGLSGENSELFFNSPIVGHDILNGQGNDTDYDGENGDDIMFQSAGIQRNNGMEGFDWAIHKGDTEAANSDLSNFLGAGAVTPAFILRDRFDSVEGLSGWKFDDTLTGATKLIVAGGGFASQITQAGVDRIEGLKYVIGKAADGVDPTLLGNAPDAVVLTDIHAGDGGEIILGGKGSDIIAGNLGNDILDGDAWLNVRISVHQDKVPVGVNNDKIPESNPEIFTVNSLTELVSGTGNSLWDGHSVADLMRADVINPGQLKAVREILNSDGTKVSSDINLLDGVHSTNSNSDIDTAVFRDVKANYTIEGASALVGGADVNGDGFITVTHTPPVAGGGGGGRLADGIDNIRNFEVLHFADGNVILKQGLLNDVATGKLAIDITTDLSLPGLNVGDTVTANLGTVADVGGLPAISAFTFNWQFEQTPGAGDWADLGETGRTLTITPLLGVDGNRLRVTATFVGANGILESVSSDPTDPVAAEVTAAATAGADLLVGTNGDDFINALAGDDDVRALAGNDIVIGGPGSDALDGGVSIGTGIDTDIDTAVFFGPQAQFTFAINVAGQLEVTDTVTGDVDVVVNFENLVFIDANAPIPDQLAKAIVLNPASAPPGVTVTSVAVADVLATFPTLPTTGDDIIIGTPGDDAISGLAGNDTILSLEGADTIFWNVGDGHDVINAGNDDGLTGAGTGADRLRIRGSAEDETFDVHSQATFASTFPGLTGLLRDVPSDTGVTLANPIPGATADAEIIITRTVGGVTEIVAELSGVDDLTFNGGGGTDTFNIIGDFTATDLNPNTITIIGTSGNETVNVTERTSSHRVVFHGGGGTDQLVGQKSQDTFDNLVVPGGMTLTAADLEALINIVRPTSSGGESEGVVGVRTLSGEGNNLAHPEFGAADTPFIRLTDAHYGAYDPATNNMSLNPIFDGLDARAISNVLSTQEADLGKNANGGNIFFMAFGQYFDHGLDFLPKGGNGKIMIGGLDVPGPPSSSNPVDLTRGSVVAGTENSVPQHINKTSTFVDQNQAYGSNSLVGQFLREGDGHGGLGAHLLAGGADPTAPDFKLLPTLRELIQHHWNNDTVFHDASLPGGQVAFQDYFAGLVGANGAINAAMVTSMAGNFMGSGHALLLDTNPFINLLDHYVAGDGRANENVSLTAIHTIWARNHNFHVDNLKAEGFTGTAAELFEAAKVVNEAEYQRVVFTEFADTLIGGMKGSGSHGHDKYNPNANASISEEFAAAVYRVGHSLISDKLTVVGSDGQLKQINLVDAFLNPTNDANALSPSLPPGYVPQPGYEQLGANSIIAGIATQQAEEVDFNIVDAVRNDLVRIGADLAAFNIARGRDVGLGTLNQVRADLKASSDSYVHEAVGFAGNLDPYTSWEDFQTRNGLSDAVINQFKQAYPDLVLDTSAKITAFQAANPDIQLVNGNTVKGIDRVDLWVGGLAEKHINDGMVGQAFWVVLHEQFDRLQEADRFYYTDRLDNLDLYQNVIDGQTFSDIVARNTGLTGLQENIFEVSAEDQSGSGNSGGGTTDSGNSGGGNTGSGNTGGNGTPGGSGTTGSGNPGSGTAGGATDIPGVLYLFQGTPGNDSLIGSIHDDVLKGDAGDDDLFAFSGDDNMLGGDGDDRLVAGDGDDILSGGAGDDDLLAGAGNDIILAGDGNDRVVGGDGDDQIWGHKGHDVINGGAGNDVIYLSAGDGDDAIHGDEGIDTLDFQAISAKLTIKLGASGIGSATSTQSGDDVISGFENVIGGSGDDTIYASNSVNVLNGGGGDDTFVFNTAAAANGDRIEGFQTGDLIDLKPLLIGLGIADGHVSQIADSAAFNAAGQIKVIFSGDDTTIQGNTDADADIDFSIVIAAHILRNQDLA